MARASADERAALQSGFAALCAIPSPSGRERRCADHVARQLTALGLAVVEDDAGAALGGDAGNLLCRIPAVGGTAADPDRGGAVETVLLCAHLDTVPVGAEIRPELRDGVWLDGHGGVLGADNKATVAVLLAVAARLARAPLGIAVELLLTVQEEPQLRGVHRFDAGQLRARSGYVVDHPSPIGGIVTAAPGHVRFDARYRGRAAHAGIAPEQGRSAILAAARAVAGLPAGRRPTGATVNVGHVEGGVSPGGPVVTNVVPAYARVLGEVRGPDRPTLQATIDEVEAVLHDAAHDTAGPVDLDLELETRFAPYAHARSSVPVQHATAALRSLGIEPRPFADAGGSDANVLNAVGVPTVNLAGGNAGAHEAGESIAAAALDVTLDLLLAILDRHARPDDGDPPTRAVDGGP